jgi:hypothetical protein
VRPEIRTPDLLLGGLAADALSRKSFHWVHRFAFQWLCAIAVVNQRVVLFLGWPTIQEQAVNEEKRVRRH